MFVDLGVHRGGDTVGTIATLNEDAHEQYLAAIDDEITLQFIEGVQLVNAATGAGKQDGILESSFDLIDKFDLLVKGRDVQSVLSFGCQGECAPKTLCITDGTFDEDKAVGVPAFTHVGEADVFDVVNSVERVAFLAFEGGGEDGG